MTDARRPGELVDVNHFVCTLGQAAALNAEKPHSYKTVNDFIDLQARQNPIRPAVGFPTPPRNKEPYTKWNDAVYSKQPLHTSHKDRETNHAGVSFPRFTTIINIART